MTDDPVFEHDDCSVEPIEPLDPGLLIDPYIPPPPDPIGDCTRDLSTLPAMPPMPSPRFCPTIRIDNTSEVVVDPGASDPSMTFSIEESDGCVFDFLLRLVLPPQLGACPTIETGIVEAYTDSELEEPSLSFTITRAAETCEFTLDFSLGIPVFDSDNFFQSINITNIGGVNVIFNSTTNNYGGSIFGGPTINNTINLGMNLTLPVKQVTFVSNILCDDLGNLTVCYQNALVLGTGIRRCLPLTCPPVSCCMTECETVVVAIVPPICGITEVYLDKDVATGEWHGTAVGTDEVIVEFRMYCLAARTFMDVYCNGHYFEYLSGELYGSCPEDSATYYAEHEETFLGLLTPFHVDNTDSETCACLFAETEYLVGVTALCGDSATILACCDPLRPVPHEVVPIEITASVGPGCTPLSFSGNLTYYAPSWFGQFSPTDPDPEVVLPDVTVLAQLVCRNELGYYLLVVVHLESGAVVTFEVPLSETTIGDDQYLVGNFNLEPVIDGCEGYFEISAEYPCDPEEEIDPTYCALCEEITVVVTPEGCDPVNFSLFLSGFQTWIGSAAMGACACPGTPIELWTLDVACLAGEWTVTGFGAPTGDSVISDITILSTNPAHFIATGTMTCGGTLPVTIEFTEVPCAIDEPL
jgi:hypothetical protein